MLHLVGFWFDKHNHSDYCGIIHLKNPLCSATFRKLSVPPLLILFHLSLFWSIICPDIQVKRVLWGQIGVYESILQIHEANSFFLFIKKGALLFYTFCTRYCITISFFIEFLTSLNIKAPPYWNPVSMCFWRYSWCNHFC